MTAKNRIALGDLPPEYREQARLQMYGIPGQPHAAPVERETPAITPDREPRLVRIPAKRQPNKTEAAYNAAHLAGLGAYEAVTLRLQGGSRYTPDFATWDGAGRMTCHEVKGSYKLGSHGRAATAFREAVAAFPHISFVWAVRRKDGAFDAQTAGKTPKNGVAPPLIGSFGRQKTLLLKHGGVGAP